MIRKFRKNSASNDATTVQKKHKKHKKSFSPSSAMVYGGVFVLIVGLLVAGSTETPTNDQYVRANSVANETLTIAEEDRDSQTVSVDSLVATRVAANIAQTTDLPVASNVANLSQSLAAENKLAKTEENIVAKPQIVDPSSTSREVKTYKTKSGDTADAVAKKYGITKQTLQWANDMTSDAIEPGKELIIPPVDGIVYVVGEDDTIEKLAEKYKANKANIIAFNDLELDGPSKGDKIVIPNGTLPEDERPGYVAPVTNTPAYTFGGTPTSGSQWKPAASPNFGSGRNTYAWGNCTWYAYERRHQLGLPVGDFWGNAATWSYYARSAGLQVDYSPAAGAIMQNGGGYGHVAIVESVVPGKYVRISEMNGYRFGGGFNRIGYGNIPWAEAVSGRYQYIH